MTARLPRDLIPVVAAFAVSGAMHLVRPRPFIAIVPRPLPAKAELVTLSGVAELACAAGLVVPRTRRVAGLLSAGLLVAVFPANVQMTVDVFRRHGPVGRGLALVRLPLQLPLIRAAWRAYRESG